MKYDFNKIIEDILSDKNHRVHDNDQIRRMVFEMQESIVHRRYVDSNPWDGTFSFSETNSPEWIRLYIQAYKELNNAACCFEIIRKEDYCLSPEEISLIENFAKTRDNFRKIRADTLSDENKDKITPEMRNRIISSKSIISRKSINNPQTDLPECIILYKDALLKLHEAGDALKPIFPSSRTEDTNRANTSTTSRGSLKDRIAIYDRFIKAKNELEECLYTAQLAAASRGMRQTLAPESYPPSQT